MLLLDKFLCYNSLGRSSYNCYFKVLRFKMKKSLTKKKFKIKHRYDEWLEIAKKQSGKGFTIDNKERHVLYGIGNYKKWISKKYYGDEDDD